jgi:hypothetical protein
VSPLAPWGERTGDDEAQPAVLAVAAVLAAVTVFVLLVVRVNIVIAIVCPEPFEALSRRNTSKTRRRQANPSANRALRRTGADQ